MVLDQTAQSQPVCDSTREFLFKNTPKLELFICNYNRPWIRRILRCIYNLTIHFINKASSYFTLKEWNVLSGPHVKVRICLILLYDNTNNVLFPNTFCKRTFPFKRFNEEDNTLFVVMVKVVTKLTRQAEKFKSNRVISTVEFLTCEFQEFGFYKIWLVLLKLLNSHRYINNVRAIKRKNIKTTREGQRICFHCYLKQECIPKASLKKEWMDGVVWWKGIP